MYLGEIIKRILSEDGYDYTEKPRTIHTVCPRCGQSDKLSILKENGATICYRGKCQFKGFFDDWLAETANITRKAAKERIYTKPGAGERLHEEFKLNLKDEESPAQERATFDPLPVSWPAYDFVPVCSRIGAGDALVYLNQRGIAPTVADHYQIHYSPKMRRIIFPIFINGTCYGWQGRAIDPVEDKDRIRNNTGFSRGSLLMFADQLINRNYAIITEGPFDAMKFYRVGGAVATMGKMVTDNQLKILKQYNINTVFLALDDDAAPEMRDLADRLRLDAYRILVPESCVIRCKKINKKADFGECTFEECIEAVKNAVKLDHSYIMTHWNDPIEVRKAAQLLRKEKYEK